MLLCIYIFHPLAVALFKQHRGNTMYTTLTDNEISLLMIGSTELQPVLQVISIEQICEIRVASPRYRLSISDGTHKHVALFPSSHNALASSGDLRPGSFVLLQKGACVAFHQTLYVTTFLSDFLAFISF